jgi:hypothetical protein
MRPTARVSASLGAIDPRHFGGGAERQNETRKTKRGGNAGTCHQIVMTFAGTGRNSRRLPGGM